jgi:hypothetical protein
MEWCTRCGGSYPPITAVRGRDSTLQASVSREQVKAVDKDVFEQRSKRLAELNKVIAALDPAIRAEAFTLLKGYVTGIADSSGASDGRREIDEDGDELMAKVFAVVETPSDNVKAAAAYWYSQHGVEGFSPAEIGEIGNRAGVTVPRRIDSTLGAAAAERKKLFRKVGKLYQPTVNGEKYFRDTFGVSKGRKPRPTDVE